MAIPEKPYTREEMYLDGIATGDISGIPETPFTRKEKYWDAIAQSDSSLAPETPYTRQEMYLNAIAQGDGTLAPERPYTREEMYLDAIAKGEDTAPERPYTRYEMYLDEIAQGGGETEHTVSGDIVSFTAKRSRPLKALSVAIEPVQDLHGYDSPWPAGGGVNKYPESTISGAINDVTLTQDGGNYVLSGTATAYTQFVSPSTFDLPAGSYTIKVFGWKSGVFAQLRSTDGQTVYADASTLGVGNFTLQAETVLKPRIIVNNGVATNMTIQIEVVEGSTAPSAYAPYSNICPISGWTEAKVWRTGKNLLPPYELTNLGEATVTPDNGEYTINGTISGYSQKVADEPFMLKAGTYILNCNGGISNSLGCQLRSTDGLTIYAWSYDSPTTFTISGDTEVKFRIVSQGGTFNNVVIKPQLELGSTATEYEPYSGDTYEITFPSSAGTVYGGTLDVTNGVLTVDRAMVDLGTLSYTKSTLSKGSVFRATINDKKAGISPLLCSQYKYQANGGFGGDDETVTDSESSGYPQTVFITDSRYDEYTTLQFVTAVSGVQLVYELATPITYQLTPQEIQTLKGANNIWADTGDVTVTFVGTPSEDESPRNAMNILLGGAYNRNGSDPSDREALNIILGR